MDWIRLEVDDRPRRLVFLRSVREYMRAYARERVIIITYC